MSKFYGDIFEQHIPLKHNFKNIKAGEFISGLVYIDKTTKLNTTISGVNDSLSDLNLNINKTLGNGLFHIDSPGLNATLNGTLFNVPPGIGQIVDFSDPTNPIRTDIVWDEKLNVTDQYVSGVRTWVTIDISGDIHQIENIFTEEDQRNYIRIGTLGHLGAPLITTIAKTAIPAYGGLNTTYDLSEAVKRVTIDPIEFEGYDTSSNKLKRNSGRIYGYGINHFNDVTNPNVVTISSQDPTPFFATGSVDVSGRGVVTIQTDVDTINFNNATTGVIEELSGNHWCNHRLYIAPATGLTAVIYGQQQYQGKLQALGCLNAESFVLAPELEDVQLMGFLTFRKEASGIVDNTDFVFTSADKYGQIATRETSLGGSCTTSVPSFKSYSKTSAGIGAGTHWSAGFYQSSITDANLDQATSTINYIDANALKGAHAFVVAGGAGSVDTGQVGLRVTGTSINDFGIRIASDTEIITDDITTLSLNQYIETDKKWNGTITYELYIVSGTPTTYSLDFNYGIAKYEDFGNRDFMVTDFEVLIQANASDTSFNVELLHHSSVGWTYSAAAFVPGNGTIIALQDDTSPEDELKNNQDASWKRAGFAFPVNGSSDEGVIIKITTGAAGSMQSADFHLGVVF